MTRAPARRRLHENRPLWAGTARVPLPLAARPSAQSWDVVIVGAGISGALMAEALTRRKRRVLVVDRRPPVQGSTLASTAMIQHEIDMPLHVLSRRIGADNAARAWRRSVAAVRLLVRLARRLDIDCGMEAKGALYLAGDDLGHRALRTEAEAREAAGIAAEYLDAAALRDRFGIDRTGAILSRDAASADPARLAAGLLAAAAARGAEIASPVEISDLAATGTGVALATRDGRLLTAGRAVFCTGYEYLPAMESRAHRVTSTWALASAPGVARPAWLDDLLVWEASNPYLYFRSTPDGRIVAGGEDEVSADAFADHRKLGPKARRIARKLRDTCGLRVTPERIWAAPFGTTTDGLPIIDRVPGMERVWTVMGFGGNGITFSAIAAGIVAAALAGRPDADAGLFAFR